MRREYENYYSWLQWSDWLYLTEYLSNKGHHVFEYDITSVPTQDLTQIPNLLLEHLIKESDFVFFLISLMLVVLGISRSINTPSSSLTIMSG